MLSKERFVPCHVRQELSEKFNFLSLIAAVGVPLLFGPVLCPIGHVILTFAHCCCKPCLPEDHDGASQQQQTQQQQQQTEVQGLSDKFGQR